MINAATCNNQLIDLMRQHNLSVGAVAELSGLSVDTVKAYRCSPKVKRYRRLNSIMFNHIQQSVQFML